jgi:hypothetical protein
MVFYNFIMGTIALIFTGFTLYCLPPVRAAFLNRFISPSLM